MKILKGKFKGRDIICPKQVRAVSGLVKKACFDILGQELEGKYGLDLFAGSGALGLEALSLGAGKLSFNDQSKEAANIIKNNINSICGQVPGIKVYCKDAFLLLEELFKRRETFDFIFLDPPYYQGIMKKILQALGEYDILAPSGYIIGFCYIKDEREERIKTARSSIELILERDYGQTHLMIYRHSE